MENILKERLVNRSDKNSFRFALICAVCGTVWESTPIPVEGTKEQYQGAYLAAKQAAHREVVGHFTICRLCGDPACENCYANLGEMAVCSKCAKRMLEK